VPAASASEGAAAPPRQPDGVSLDLSAARVDAHSTAPARGVVALYPPPAREDVLAIVRAYFHAFGGGNERDFVSVLMPDARRLDDGGRTDLGSSLERRLRSFDYAHAPIESMVHYDDARMTTYDAAPPALRHANQMQDGDVLIDVPIEEVRVGSSRLFGPRALFVLRRQGGGRWRIAGVNEDGPWS
jgi:hypothetical protein